MKPPGNEDVVSPRTWNRGGEDRVAESHKDRWDSSNKKRERNERLYPWDKVLNRYTADGDCQADKCTASHDEDIECAELPLQPRLSAYEAYVVVLHSFPESLRFSLNVLEVQALRYLVSFRPNLLLVYPDVALGHTAHRETRALVSPEGS